IISTEQAIEWFGLEAVGRSPSRFDFAKLENLNGHYIRAASDERLTEATLPFLEQKLGHSLTPDQRAHLTRAMPGLKVRAKTVVELADGALFYFLQRPLTLTEKAAKLLDDEGKAALAKARDALVAVEDWQEATLEARIKELAEQTGLKLGKIAQPLRAALTGGDTSPGIFEVLALLGRDESLARIGDQAG